ncbi:hypothetical protein [Candidatus Anaplasma sp. TIGMIC]|uniref:hypothetical protein n=1 Tax=Candidatus Anaplasma sp. TIGMIC TaxID=3020713 RepID=UPI00232DC003|nr:hypothetical protein [Candidatus Anaplasma sp. TIGMIC]MDB1135645.1 hypothetical protein [Candidatus Anaplasma sp. TIGMIC]
MERSVIGWAIHGTYGMRSEKLYSSLAVFYVITSVLLSCECNAANEKTKRNPLVIEADLQLTLGLYQEGGKYLLPFMASESEKKAVGSNQESDISDATNNSSSPTEDTLHFEKNYSALASISYVMRTRSFGNFSAGMGYSYRVNYLRRDMLKDISKKVMRDALPYAELSWEKKGILLLRKLSLGSSMRLWIKDEKGQGYPLHMSCSIRYGIGDITSIYIGLHVPTSLPSLKFAEGVKYPILPVIGIEFSI